MAQEACRQYMPVRLLPKCYCALKVCFDETFGQTDNNSKYLLTARLDRHSRQPGRALLSSRGPFLRQQGRCSSRADSSG